jgi:hypothetical protein
VVTGVRVTLSQFIGREGERVEVIDNDGKKILHNRKEYVESYLPP